jgi:EmrB/QacA subfamily drug resistance transporter
MGVALPAIARDLGATGRGIDVDWVITSFLLGVVLVQPATGWLADTFGRKRVYVASLVLFAVGAAIGAAAPSMLLLVAGRLVQGVGAGALMPVGMATIYDLFPADRRGTALGVWGVAIMAAPAVGPPLGGWLVTYSSWRWVFLAFVVVASAAAVLAVRLLEDVGHQERRRLDLVGWVLAGTAVTLIIVGTRQAAGADSGSTAVAMGLVGAVVGAFLVWRSLRRPHPIIEFRMFATPTFSIAMVVVALLTMAQFARLNFLPVELQVVRGLDAQQVGLLLAPAALGVALTMPLSGWLADRVGARLPVVTGLLIVAASMWQLAHLTPEVSDRRVVVILVIQGLGTGLAMIPGTVAAMNSLPGRFVAQATAVNSLNRQLAGAVSVAVLAAVLVGELGAVAPVNPDVAEAQAAYNGIFLVAFWVIVATVVAALFLPGRRRMREHQADRARELVDP